MGDAYEHARGRTLTSTDDAWSTLLTQDTARLHFDRHDTAQTEFGPPLVNSTLTLALVTARASSTSRRT